MYITCFELNRATFPQSHRGLKGPVHDLLSGIFPWDRRTAIFRRLTGLVMAALPEEGSNQVLGVLAYNLRQRTTIAPKMLAG